MKNYFNVELAVTLLVVFLVLFVVSLFAVKRKLDPATNEIKTSVFGLGDPDKAGDKEITE